MNTDDDLRPSLFESLNLALAVVGVVAVGFMGKPVMHGISAVQNKLLDTALALGEHYARGRRIANERIGKFEHFMGSVMGGGDRC